MLASATHSSDLVFSAKEQRSCREGESKGNLKRADNPFAGWSSCISSQLPRVCSMTSQPPALGSSRVPPPATDVFRVALGACKNDSLTVKQLKFKLLPLYLTRLTLFVEILWAICFLCLNQPEAITSITRQSIADVLATGSKNVTHCVFQLPEKRYFLTVLIFIKLSGNHT